MHIRNLRGREPNPRVFKSDSLSLCQQKFFFSRNFQQRTGRFDFQLKSQKQRLTLI